MHSFFFKWTAKYVTFKIKIEIDQINKYVNIPLILKFEYPYF